MLDSLTTSDAADEISRLISYVSYRAFLAGAVWGHGQLEIDYDDDAQAWEEWVALDGSQ